MDDDEEETREDHDWGHVASADCPCKVHPTSEPLPEYVDLTENIL